MKRGDFPKLAVILLGISACAPAPESHAPASSNNTTQHEDIMDGPRLFRYVEQYARFTPHQTGSDGDLATADWLGDELRAAGFDVELQPWQFRRFALEECALLVDGAPVDAFPFWFPKQTGDAPVTGPLTRLADEDLGGQIAVVFSEQAGRGIYNQGVNMWAEKTAESGAVGLIVVVPAVSGEIAAINAVAPYHVSPLPVPSVLVSIRDEEQLAAAVAEGKTASIAIRGTEFPVATAKNVIGRLERGERWVVVTTPSSGWFTCAGERGPGVALFVALAQWAARSDSKFSFLFMANSGHELDNLGAHHTLEKFAPPVEKTVLWIHLGASIATRAWVPNNGGFVPTDQPNDQVNLVGTDGLVPLLERAFADVPWMKPRSGEPVRGELRHFIAAGYRAFGFFGGHHYFHTRSDMPATTGPEFLGPVGAALVRVLEAIEAE